MKGKISSMWRVVIALALVASLSLVVAAPVSAATAVGQPVVTVSPTTEDLNAKYTIVFTATTDLAKDQSIFIDFTSNATGGTEIPQSGYETGDVTVNGALVTGANVKAVADANCPAGDDADTITDNDLEIVSPVDIAAGSSVTVIFNKTADILNPADPASCTLYVATDSDATWKQSEEYIISGYLGRGVNLYTDLDEFVNSYTTIQAAEDAASTSYTIRVEPGTYTENLAISVETLTLESTGGKDVTTIVGEMTIAAEADGFVLGGAEGKGFTFNDISTGDSFLVRTAVSPNNVTISYNAFESMIGVHSCEAIFVGSTCAGLTVTENSFTAHNIYDMGITTMPGDVVSNFTITNNTFIGCGNTVDHSGIELRQLNIESTDTIISGNTFTDWYVGVMIGNNVGAGGLVCADATGVLKISGNTFDNCRYGLDIVNAQDAGDTTQNLLVVGNTFSNCTYYGLPIDYGPCLEATDYLEPGDFTVKFNNISGNSLYGLYNNKSENVDVSHNWWGDASGPSGEGPGSGDAITTYVTPYSPYLGASISAADYTLSASTLHCQSTVGVDVTSSETAAIGVASYTGNPQGTPGFTALGFFDVYASKAWGTGAVVNIKLYADGVTSSSKAYFWSDTQGAWVECYDTGASSSGGFVWVKVRAYSAVYPERVPVLTDLTELPFAISSEAPTEEKGDFDGDGDIDLGDFVDFAAAYGSSTGDANYNVVGDFDDSGDVGLADFVDFATAYGA